MGVTQYIQTQEKYFDQKNGGDAAIMGAYSAAVREVLGNGAGPIQLRRLKTDAGKRTALTAALKKHLITGLVDVTDMDATQLAALPDEAKNALLAQHFGGFDESIVEQYRDKLTAGQFYQVMQQEGVRIAQHIKERDAKGLITRADAATLGSTAPINAALAGKVNPYTGSALDLNTLTPDQVRRLATTLAQTGEVTNASLEDILRD